jgi:hypothetical protein
MQLHLSDPSYADRLATFLRSLGQTVRLVAADRLNVDLPNSDTARGELMIYLRVWRVLYPDADVQLLDDNGADGELPAA